MSRGTILLSMIQLDIVNIELFSQEPISYEAYISSFGHSNRAQVSMSMNGSKVSNLHIICVRKIKILVYYVIFLLLRPDYPKENLFMNSKDTYLFYEI